MSSTIGRHHWLPRIVLAAFGIGVIALAGCSSSGNSGSGGGGGSGGAAQNVSGSSGMTVAVKSTDKGEVLTNSSGRTLYESDQEKGKVLCKSSACTAIWTPLTVPAAQKPTGPSELAGSLTTVKRPDGKSQVALNGRPLYTFSFDHSAGEVNGEGTRDSFDGTNFSWHAATANGALAPAPATTSSSSNPYNY
jgi:predicted lipoprotein with Yx(FWY)xxD motif